MNRESTGSTIGELLGALRDESTTLLRQEVALARAELAEKAAEVGKNSLAVAKGGAIAYAGGIVLLIGVGHLAQLGLVAAGLSEGVAQWLGFVIVGAVVALAGWTMLARAKRALSATNLLPGETLASLHDNRRWAQDKIHHAHEPAT